MAEHLHITPIGNDGIYCLDTASWRVFRPVMDKEKCVTYTYTYKWTTSSGTAREDSHIFFVNWVKKQS